jgi:O-antigen/teichoic acid export membrane protein
VGKITPKPQPPDGTSHQIGPGLRKILHNISWLFVERLLMMVMSLFVGIYLIRYLGAENFGKLSYSISFVGLFEAIAKLGLDPIVVRSLVQEEKKTPEILGTAFFLKLMSSLATIILINFVILNVKDTSQLHWMILTIASGLALGAFDVIDLWFQSQILAGAIAAVRSVQIIFSSLVKLLFIYFKFPLIAFAGLIVADLIFRSCGMIWVYFKFHQSFLRWRFNRSQAIAMLKDSWPLILSGFTIALYLKIDQVMLGNMASIQEVGNYAAAVRFSEIWYFVPVAICSSIFPAILKAKQRNKQDYYDKIQQLYDLMVWLSLAIALVMSLNASTLMTALLGKEYLAAGGILAWHIWSSPFVFLGVARSQWLMAENFTRLSFATTSLGAVTNIVLNFLLIPTYGGTGAALATLVSYAVATYISCFLFPVMFRTAWMLTKALFVPFRIRQNLIYLSNVKSFLG